MVCPDCAAVLPEGSESCPVCGKPAVTRSKEKNKVLAGILALTLGVFGVHNFYLGHRPKAVTQLVMSTIGGIFSCGVSTIVIGVWALAEGIRLLFKAK